MQKIFVQKEDSAEAIIEKILKATDETIILVIPKNADLKESLHNFHSIKQKATSAEKTVFVESVDDDVLAMAEASHLEAAHPLFRIGMGGAVSDIVPSGQGEKAKRMKKGAKKLEITAEENIMEGKPEFVEIPHRRSRKGLFPGYKVALGIVAVLILVLASAWIVDAFWSKATVTITLKKTPWTLATTVVGDKALTAIAADHNAIPAEVFSRDKNFTQLFPASKKGTVSQKATGKITVYNAFNSSPQTLVAKTRFVTPDGKLFRLVSKVIIPGATTTGGKLVPSHIDADAVADVAGPAYNIGPVARLAIPGFQGTPRYAGFYGTIIVPMAGGFVGEKMTPTQDDITKAKNRVSDILQLGLKSNLITQAPPDFKILDGATSIQLTRLTVNENTDSQGNFSVFGDASSEAIGFREADLKALLGTLASRDNPNTVFHDLKIDYSSVKLDFSKGQISFALSAQGSLQSDFSADDFKAKVAGQSLDFVRSLVGTIPGMAEAKVSVWPFWLRSFPDKANHINIAVD